MTTDDRTPEERLLSKKRLGSFYLDDVRALIQRAEAAEAEIARLRDGLRRIEESQFESTGQLRHIARALLTDQDGAARRPSRKDELIAGMVALADDLEAGTIFWQDFPPDMRKRLRRVLLADQDGAA